MPKKIKLDIDVAPHVEDKVKVEPIVEPERSVVVSDYAKEESKEQAIAFTEDDDSDKDDDEDYQEAKQEADYEGEPVENVLNESNPQSNNGFQANVEELENELGKFKMLVQGSDTRDSFLGNSLPFDMALSNIKSPEERAIFRLDGQAYLEACSLFGRDSPYASELLQILKSDIMISRADNSMLSKLLVTNISQNFTDKTVNRSDKQTMVGQPKQGLFGGKNPDSPYQQNF